MANPTERKFLYSRLLIALVLLLLVGTLVSQHIGGPVIYVLMTIVMGFAVWSSSRNRWLTFGILAVGFANAATSIWIAVAADPSSLTIILNRFFGVLFVGGVGTFMVSEMWRLRHVTLDTISGGLSVYLLLGIGWAHIYSLIETIQPGSFIMRSFVDETQPLWQNHPGAFPQLLFFSYVTLTTLGYGNIVPATPASTVFAIAEAVTGPVFLAILMARLVGLYVAQETRDPEARGRGRDA